MVKLIIFFCPRQKKLFTCIALYDAVPHRILYNLVIGFFILVLIWNYDFCFLIHRPKPHVMFLVFFFWQWTMQLSSNSKCYGLIKLIIVDIYLPGNSTNRVFRFKQVSIIFFYYLIHMSFIFNYFLYNLITSYYIDIVYCILSSQCRGK